MNVGRRCGPHPLWMLGKTFPDPVLYVDGQCRVGCPVTSYAVVVVQLNAGGSCRGRFDRRCGASLKRFACGDVIPGCGGVFTGAGDQSVLDQVLAHVAADHGLGRPLPFIELVMAHTHPFVPPATATCGWSIPTRADGSTPPPPAVRGTSSRWTGTGTRGSLSGSSAVNTGGTSSPSTRQCAPAAGTGPTPPGQGPRDVPTRVRAVRRNRRLPGRRGAVRPGRAGPAGTGDGRRRRAPVAGAAVCARRGRRAGGVRRHQQPPSATTRP